MKRIIRPVPQDTIEPVPAGGMIVNGMLDYIVEGDQVPKDAVYVATMDERTKQVTVDLDTKEAFVHTYAGWPVPGEPIPVIDPVLEPIDEPVLEPLEPVTRDLL